MAGVKGRSGGLRNPKGGLPKGYKHKSTLRREAIRDRLLKRYDAVADEMFDKQVIAANGHWELDKSGEDGTKVAEVRPNPTAWRNVHEMIVGKLREEVDVTTNGKDLPTPILNLLRDDPSATS